jgi:hypothetical protein
MDGFESVSRSNAARYMHLSPETIEEKIQLLDLIA